MDYTQMQEILAQLEDPPDEEINCAIRACCPEEAEAAFTLSDIIARGVHAYTTSPRGQACALKGDEVERVALCAAATVIKVFDLAPKGTLTPLVEAVVKVSTAKDRGGRR